MAMPRSNTDLYRSDPSPTGVYRSDSDWSIFDLGVDPANYAQGMPPNLGERMLPHVQSFQGVVSSQARVYRPSDEAMKHSFDNARFMRNDPLVMECIEMRQRAVSLFDWHVEPEDDKDPEQQEIAETLTKMIERVPRFMQYRENLLHATWYGKYGVQQRWQWRRMFGEQRIAMTEWLPVNGDKIVFRYDDGLRRDRPDQIGIRVGYGFNTGPNIANKWNKDFLQKVEATDHGLAYFLDTWERPLMAVHKHQIEDGEYEEPTNAGRIHGKGIRSVIYWCWYQKQEALAWLMEYLERSAAGFDVWYYPMNNPQAESATKDAALKRSTGGGSRNILFVPLPQGEDAPLYRVEHYEPGMAGADQLKAIITEYFGHQIKRYILGQTLTSEAQATGLGSGLADVQLDVFMQIVRYDAQLLEESITTELLQPILRYNFPRFMHHHFRFRIDTEVPDSEKRLEALRQAYDMGLRIDAQHVRDLIGTPAPEEDAEVLDRMAAMQQQAEHEAAQMGQNGDAQDYAANAIHAPSGFPFSPAGYNADGPPSENSERDRLIASDDPRPDEGIRDMMRRVAKEYYNKKKGFREEEHPRDDKGKFTDKGASDMTGDNRRRRVPLVQRGSLELYPVRVTTDPNRSAEVDIDDSTGEVTVNNPRRLLEKQDVKIMFMRSIDEHFSPLAPDQFIRVTHNKDDYEHLKAGTHRGSRNHATGEMEGGLSVAKVPETSAQYSYLVTGRVIGQGSDGEPLLDLETSKPVSEVMDSGDFWEWFFDAQKQRIHELGWRPEEVRKLKSSFVLLNSDEYEKAVR